MQYYRLGMVCSQVPNKGWGVANHQRFKRSCIITANEKVRQAVREESVSLFAEGAIDHVAKPTVSGEGLQASSQGLLTACFLGLGPIIGSLARTS